MEKIPKKLTPSEAADAADIVYQVKKGADIEKYLGQQK